MESAKVVLCMIVKNESKIIERCLEAAGKCVDAISICDTGSVDNTVEVINKMAAKLGLPVKVHNHTWKNFGHNRTLSYKGAKSFAAELGYNLEKTYTLFLDADMILKVVDPTFKSKLDADCYQIIQGDDEQRYPNLRMALMKHDWVSKGPTHEYWAPIGRQELLDALFILDLGDGGCKSDKFQRDVRLLLEGLVDEPTNERYVFYLAQSYKCLGDVDASIKWYNKRTKMGGYFEEVGYSYFQLGNIYYEMKELEKAAYYYMCFFDVCPHRAEGLHGAARIFREHGRNRMSYDLTKIALGLSVPKEALFTDLTVYNVRLLYELSIVSYYMPGKQEEGEFACNALILKNFEAEGSLRNLEHYIKAIPTASEPTKLELIKKRKGKYGGVGKSNLSKYIQSSISVLGCMSIVRTINYTQTGATDYKSMDSDGYIRTQNYLCNIVTGKYYPIVEANGSCHYPIKETNVLGMEDCRMIDENYFLCTVCDYAGCDHATMALCKMDNAVVTDKWCLAFDNECQKNWLPFIYEGRVRLVFKYNPFAVLTLVLPGEEYPEGEEQIPLKAYVDGGPRLSFHTFEKKPMSRSRGSAPPIKFGDGYLLLTHEVAFSKVRTYYHRFMLLDSKLKLLKASKAFYFGHKGVEYCLSIQLNQHDDVVCYVSIEDKETYKYTIKSETIKELMIHPV